MQHMAEKVKQCLIHTQYGGNQCVTTQSIGGDENFVFNDEELVQKQVKNMENQAQAK